MPDEPEALGLLALMLLQESRRPARVDGAGSWCRSSTRTGPVGPASIDEGFAALDRALRLRRPGPYQVQAAIAACHATAPPPMRRIGRKSPPCTGSWRASCRRRSSSSTWRWLPPWPRVRPAGLVRVEALEASGALRGYHLLAATRADLLRRLGRRTEAAAAYRQAIDLTRSEVERRYFERRLAEVGGDLGGSGGGPWTSSPGPPVTL